MSEELTKLQESALRYGERLVPLVLDFLETHREEVLAVGRKWSRSLGVLSDLSSEFENSLLDAARTAEEEWFEANVPGYRESVEREG